MSSALTRPVALALGQMVKRYHTRCFAHFDRFCVYVGADRARVCPHTLVLTHTYLQRPPSLHKLLLRLPPAWASPWFLVRSTLLLFPSTQVRVRIFVWVCTCTHVRGHVRRCSLLSTTVDDNRRCVPSHTICVRTMHDALRAVLNARVLILTCCRLHFSHFILCCPVCLVVYSGSASRVFAAMSSEKSQSNV